MRLQSNGSVGIGTTTPFLKFHVNSGNSFFTSMLEAQDANNAGPHQYFYSGGEFSLVDYIRTDYALDPNRQGALEVRGFNRLNLSPTNSIDMLGGMTIISNGNVGIGQPTPVAQLHINNTAAGRGGLFVNQNTEVLIPGARVLSGGVITNDASITFPALMGKNSIYAQRGDF
ncbi:MAG: hypothetical protein IPP43_03010 [Chitinophagaceae bacterium]|nr:hypothetical protein [Chitinophagaceae bacterium]